VVLYVLDRKTAAGPFVLDAAPEWIVSWPETVKLLPNGQWSDNQGQWVNPTGDRVLGESGRVATLAYTKSELLEAQEARSPAQQVLERAIRQQQWTRSALRREERRCESSQALS
jgi:hypothetical protein